MIVYKVVRPSKGRTVSAFVEGEAEINYIPGVEIKPKVGKIFVFTDLKKARDFLVGSQIWKSEATNVKRIRRLIPNNVVELKNMDMIAYFWKGDRRWKDMAPKLGHPPKGSAVCDSITLLERAW